jgi:hypothetical protein
MYLRIKAYCGSNGIRTSELWIRKSWVYSPHTGSFDASFSRFVTAKISLE